jgi:hypothetical protein
MPVGGVPGADARPARPSRRACAAASTIICACPCDERTASDAAFVTAGGSHWVATRRRCAGAARGLAQRRRTAGCSTCRASRADFAEAVRTMAGV